MILEEKLVSLLARDDVRPLVRALCVCARRYLPEVERIDPFNATIVETAEAWVAGSCDASRVQEVHARARATRGATFTAVCLGVIAGAAAGREPAVRLFARQLPTTLWFASEAGRRWTKAAGAFAQVGQDPEATAQIAAVHDELCALVDGAAVAGAGDASRVRRLKIVYVGPGLAGKATNVQYARERAHPSRRGLMATVPTAKGYRNLVFDFRLTAPIAWIERRMAKGIGPSARREAAALLGVTQGRPTQRWARGPSQTRSRQAVGAVRPPSGIDYRVQLCALPGSVFYRAARVEILAGADGIIFVADSQVERAGDDLVSLDELGPDLAANDIELQSIPIVLQYNKRDAPSALPVDELDAMLNASGWPRFEAVATRGEGVLETLGAVLRAVVARVESRRSDADP